MIIAFISNYHYIVIIIQFYLPFMANKNPFVSTSCNFIIIIIIFTGFTASDGLIIQVCSTKVKSSPDRLVWIRLVFRMPVESPKQQKTIQQESVGPHLGGQCGFFCTPNPTFCQNPKTC